MVPLCTYFPLMMPKGGSNMPVLNVFFLLLLFLNHYFIFSLMSYSLLVSLWLLTNWIKLLRPISGNPALLKRIHYLSLVVLFRKNMEYSCMHLIFVIMKGWIFWAYAWLIMTNIKWTCLVSSWTNNVELSFMPLWGNKEELN